MVSRILINSCCETIYFCVVSDQNVRWHWMYLFCEIRLVIVRKTSFYFIGRISVKIFLLDVVKLELTF